jgi:hypothetical protein
MPIFRNDGAIAVILDQLSQHGAMRMFGSATSVGSTRA